MSSNAWVAGARQGPTQWLKPAGSFVIHDSLRGCSPVRSRPPPCRGFFITNKKPAVGRVQCAGGCRLITTEKAKS